MVLDMENASEFEDIDLSTFLGNQAAAEVSASSQSGELFTERQRKLLNEILPIVRERQKERYEIFINRIAELESMANSVAKFPSLLARQELAGGTRTRDTLIESLIKHQDDTDRTLRLPSKAILGKALLVAKTHTLSDFANFAKHSGAEYEHLAKAFDNETILSIFTLLAEDVYLNLISDNSQPMEFRREWALSLILLWEHWNDQTSESVAPVLQSVWTARRRLAPAFGTMMGTSELLLISMQMDDQWISFIKQKMGDQGVTQAMEEFLFGISTEQISELRTILKTKGISAIGRDEVSKFLGEHVKADAGLDYRDFYSLYTVRRDNARSRTRMKLEGPHKTLEDYFIQFVTEQNKEKQNNDTFAK